VAGLNYEDWVVLDKKFLRPAEVDTLLGDPTRAEKELQWRRKVSFEKMIQMMVESDIDRYRKMGFTEKKHSPQKISMVTEL
ncbi:MAG: hypothetical protein EBS74_09830, partial [Flavobacteriia bacterium]|nr:hypothetical protein [Flavobacteriia bacterium]